MKNQADLVQRWDDIIFKNRNKSYGAYAIRKDYNSNVIKAEAISIGIGALIFMIPVFIPDKITPDIPIITEPKGKIVLEGIKIKPDQPSAKTTPVKRIKASVIPIKVTPRQVQDEPLTPQTTETSFTKNPEQGTIESRSETNGSTGSETIELPSPPPYVLAPEVMPMYEGGMEAMMKFIQRKMHYPRKAQENREEGIVFVSFIINPMGEVTGVEVIKGFNKECDQEAVRVISLMKKWKPGQQNKMSVAVKMVLPIKFKLGS